MRVSYVYMYFLHCLSYIKTYKKKFHGFSFLVQNVISFLVSTRASHIEHL